MTGHYLYVEWGAQVHRILRSWLGFRQIFGRFSDNTMVGSGSGEGFLMTVVLG